MRFFFYYDEDSLVVFVNIFKFGKNNTLEEHFKYNFPNELMGMLLNVCSK